jgi:hypothetical protein
MHLGVLRSWVMLLLSLACRQGLRMSCTQMPRSMLLLPLLLLLTLRMLSQPSSGLSVALLQLARLQAESLHLQQQQQLSVASARGDRQQQTRDSIPLSLYSLLQLATARRGRLLPQHHHQQQQQQRQQNAVKVETIWVPQAAARMMSLLQPRSCERLPGKAARAR